MTLHEFPVSEIERRKGAFMAMWRQMLPLVEQEVQLSYAEIKELVSLKMFLHPGHTRLITVESR